jgi:TetR/AcrR family transcriptional regulator, fatty acid metabolism regulator protein
MVYRKTKVTEERREARRRLLLDAAITLFAQHGFHATTVPMIVVKAQSSIGSFYLHFRNKEDVLNVALEELGQAVSKVMNDLMESQPDALKRVSLGVEKLFTFLAQNPEKARILIVESSGISSRIEKTRRAILLQQEYQVRQTHESTPSLFAVENTMIAARCVVGAAFEVLYRWLEEDPKTRMPAAEVAKVVAQFNVQAVKRMQVGSGCRTKTRQTKARLAAQP